jgi:beta-N-acetylhexosaminidase
MSDDICMGALSGPTRARSRAAIAAGCDVILHCNGKLAEMQEVAAEVPRLSGAALERAGAALSRRSPPAAADIAELRAEWAMLMDLPVVTLRTIS